MQATPPVESTPLSDEAILGIEPESTSTNGGYEAPDSANAPDADPDFEALDAMGDLDDRPARGRHSDRQDAAQSATDGNREGQHATREGKNDQRLAREDKDAQQSQQQRDANAARNLPLGSLAEFDAGFYSGDAASRTALAQSLFASDPAAFRAMFDEAARLLGASGARELRNTDAREASAHGPTPALVDNDRRSNAPVGNDQSQNDSRTALRADDRSDALRADDRSNALRADRDAQNAAPNAANSQPGSPAFPAESYRAFEASTNEAVARDVRGAITRTLEQVLPEGVAEGAAKRIGEDIFGEVGKLLAADAQLSSQVGESLRGWRFGAAEQQQVASLLSGRARQILPSVARRVIGEWTNSVLSTARTRATRSEAAARRVDVGGAASGDPAARSAGRPLRPREIDYARTSDDDIFAM
jgi:hypothetical protein